MQTEFTDQPLHAIDCDLLALGVSEDIDTELSALQGMFGTPIERFVAAQKFTGKAGQTLELPGIGSVTAPTVVLVGTGSKDAADLRSAAGMAGRVARDRNAAHLAVDLGAPLSQDALEAIGVGNYVYQTYRPESKRTQPVSTLTVRNEALDASAADIRVEAQSWARDLVNAPPAALYPETLANQARKLGNLPGVTVEIWDEARLRQEDCVGILAVGQGSSRPPCMIRIQYRPDNAKAHVALVGKGVTFDAGGLSLKPSGAMQTMRCDMGGAATVLGITHAVAKAGLPVALDTFVGAVENMVSGNSYKLGDVLTYRNGVQVEIHNTDAEGRLVLADCLIEACKAEGPTHILDFATLTGACVVALGSDFSGLFTSDDALADELLGAAKQHGEGLWRLPLHAPYNEMLRAEWGQIKNVGGREAGASTAALFLGHFVEEGDKRWAHIDIAGPAFLDKKNGMYAAGGTGQMVRAISTWIDGLGA